MTTIEAEVTGNSNFAQGYTIAVCSAVVLSTTAILIRHLTQTYQLPALVLAFWRDVFAVLTLLPALRILAPDRLRLPKQHLPYLVLYGFILAIFNSLWTLSVALNGASVATVLSYCSAAFTVFLGGWFLKERVDWAKFLAVLFCLGGCVLVSEALNLAVWNTNVLGIMIGVFSGLAYAVYSLMGRFAAQRGLNPWTSLVYLFSFAAFFLLLFNLLPVSFLPGKAAHLADFLWLGKSLPGWGVLFLLAAGPTVVGFGLYNVSLVYLPSSVVNLIATLEPVSTSIIAYFFLGERMRGIQIAGGLMILAGVVFLRVYEGWVIRRTETVLV